MATSRQETPGSPEPTPLDDYKEFIDALVHIRPCVSARWVREKRRWPISPAFPENRAINRFLDKLTDSQREVLAVLLQEARDGGIHDVLAYLTDEINLGRLRLVRNGRDVPVEPFGTELSYDWTCRREGQNWPPVEGQGKA